MWDADASGCINLKEMTNIIATMDDVEGVEQENKVNCTQVLHSKSSIGTTGNPAKTWERIPSLNLPQSVKDGGDTLEKG